MGEAGQGELEVTRAQGTDATHNVNEGFSPPQRHCTLENRGFFYPMATPSREKMGPAFISFFCPLQESQANKSPEQIYHFSFSPTPSFSFLLYFFKIGLEQDGWFPRPRE